MRSLFGKSFDDDKPVLEEGCNQTYFIKKYDINGKKVPVYHFYIGNIEETFGSKITSALYTVSNHLYFKGWKVDGKPYSNVMWVRDANNPSGPGGLMMNVDLYTEPMHLNFDSIGTTITAVPFHDHKQYFEELGETKLDVSLHIPYTKLGLVLRFDYEDYDSTQDGDDQYAMLRDEERMNKIKRFLEDIYKD
ncbi:MAG: hypothetical protein K2M73_09530 [Lachnospiraceae bacterium]|nr:hypothetical protein [Lachnospiraceae bacterium]